MGNTRQKLNNMNSINKVDSNLQEGLQNLFELQKWLKSQDFQNLLETFGDLNTDSINLISKILSENKIKVLDLTSLSIDVNNILEYDERDELNDNLQNIIGHIFIKKLYDIVAPNNELLNLFILTFGEFEKIKNKKTSFKSIKINIKDFLEKYPNLLDEIKISNQEVFDGLKRNGYNVNERNSFWDQDLSSQHIIATLLSWQNKETIRKLDGHQNNVYSQIQEVGKPVDGEFPLCESDDEILRLKEEICDIEEDWTTDRQNEINKINKSIRKEYLKKMGGSKENNDVVEVLEKLVENNFNFWELDWKEQTIFANKFIEKTLWSNNEFLSGLNVDNETYKDFLRELFDFEKLEHELKITLADGNEIILDIKKWFHSWEHNQFLDVENFKETKNFPIFFDINLEKNPPEIIELLEHKENGLLSCAQNHDGVFGSYFTKNWEICLGNNYKIKLEWVDLTVDELDSMFNKDKDDLEILLKKFWLWEKTKTQFYEITKNKKLLKSFADNPHNGSIFEEMLKKLDLEIESKNLKFDLNNINKISHLYIFWKSDLKSEVEGEQQSTWVMDKGSLSGLLGLNEMRWTDTGESLARETFEDLENYAYEEDPYYNFDEIKNKYNSLDQDWKNKFEEILKQLSDESDDEPTKNLTKELLDYLHWTEDDNENNKDEETPREHIEETEEEKFMKERESLAWYDFYWEEDKGFRVGTRLFINAGGSKLPPMDKNDSFFEFEIVSIWSSTFNVKVIWNEIQSDSVGQIFTLPKTAEHLSKIKSSGEVFKVAKIDGNDWDTSIKNIIKSNFFKNLNVFGDKEWQVKLKNWKLVNNKWEEIHSFGRSNAIWDWNKKGRPWQAREHTTYEIKNVNKSKWTVKVACNFEWQDENDLSKFLNYKYENELSFEKFILLMESKGLRAYTKQEYEDRVVEYNIDCKKHEKVGYPQKGLLKFYSLAAIGGALKNGFKTIQDWIKKVREDQTEDFENFLYSQWWLNLYSKLWSLTSIFGIFPTMSEAFDRVQLEFYNERENKTWKKIEIWYKMYESDPHFSSLRNSQLKDLLTTPWYVGWDRNRHKVAAAFLILMKKDWPYGRGWLLQYLWKWFWVEKFLWKEHRIRFKNMQEERKRQLEEYSGMESVHWRKKKQAELNRLEFDYIVWIIDGRQPFLSLSDEYLWAGIWSRKFANTLSEHSNAYFTSFKKRSDEIWEVWFRQSEQEYFRMITAGRIGKALPYLKRIMEDAQSKDEQSRAKMYFLWAMLTGLIKNGWEEWVMSEFWAIARTMWFLPWIWCRDTDQVDKLIILLDGITSKPPFTRKFSDELQYKKADFELWTFNPNQKNMNFLSKDLPNYWKKYWNKILDILEFRDMTSENSIINLATKWGADSYVYKDIINLSREGTKEDISQKVSYTYWYYTNSPWTANKWVVEKLVPRNGDYKWKENIEIEAAEEFWKSVWRSLETWKQSNRWIVDFYLWKFWNRFDIDARDQWNVNFLMRWLSLVKKLKLEGKHKEAKYNLWYLIKWNLHQKLWTFPSEFGVVIDKFYDFFYNNVELIDGKMARNTFGAEAEIGFNNPYWMLNWNEFYNYVMAMEWISGGWKARSDYQRKHKRNEDNYINWNISGISKYLRQKNISGQPSVPKSNEEVEYKKA